jgi:hypothetical protein
LPAIRACSSGSRSVLEVRRATWFEIQGGLDPFSAESRHLIEGHLIENA